MNYKFLTLPLSIIGLASLMFSCDDQDSTEIEPVAEEEVIITHVPDEEDDIGGRSPFGSIAASPGLYGPTSVKAGQTYTYNLVLPAGHLERYPSGEYGINLLQRCPTDNQDDCFRQFRATSPNSLRDPFCCSSFRITFPYHWKGDSLQIRYWYYNLLYTKNIKVT